MLKKPSQEVQPAQAVPIGEFVAPHAAALLRASAALLVVSLLAHQILGVLAAGFIILFSGYTLADVTKTARRARPVLVVVLVFCVLTAVCQAHVGAKVMPRIHGRIISHVESCEAAPEEAIARGPVQGEHKCPYVAVRNQFADVLVDEIKRNRAEDGPWFMDALFTAVASTLSKGTQEEKCGYVGKWLLHVVWGSMAMWVLLNLCVVATACSALGCASEVAKVGVAPSAASSRAYALFAA